MPFFTCDCGNLGWRKNARRIRCPICAKRRNRRYNKEYQKTWNVENAKKLQQYYKEYKQGHKEHYKQQDRGYYKVNREERLEQAREYYTNNREKKLAYQREWQKKNPDKILAQGHTRRARKTGGRFSTEQIYDLLVAQSWHCYYCKRPIVFAYHIDHKVPISRGGNNNISNIALACPDCNLRKFTKTAEEFIACPLKTA